MHEQIPALGHCIDTIHIPLRPAVVLVAAAHIPQLSERTDRSAFEETPEQCTPSCRSGQPLLLDTMVGSPTFMNMVIGHAISNLWYRMRVTGMPSCVLKLLNSSTLVAT